MKKIFMIACVLVLATGFRAFAQDLEPATVKEEAPRAKQPPANALSFSFLDLVKFSVGSLQGDISYTRRLSASDRLRFSLGGQFQRNRNTSGNYPGQVRSRMGYGVELGAENLFCLGRGLVVPYLGFGLSGALLGSVSQDYGSAVDTSETYSGGIVMPLGIELDATERFKVGIDGAVTGSYSCTYRKQAGVGLVAFDDAWIARFSSLKLYFSFWF